MNFFLEFVSCCGTACLSNSVITAAAVKPAEDRKLVSLYAGAVPVVENTCRRKHRLTTVSRSGSSGEYWRPALNAISEDIEENRAANHGSDRLGKKRKVANSPRKIQAPHHSLDDFRRAPLGATVPTFSPTPFFF